MALLLFCTRPEAARWGFFDFKLRSTKGGLRDHNMGEGLQSFLPLVPPPLHPGMLSCQSWAAGKEQGRGASE